MLVLCNLKYLRLFLKPRKVSYYVDFVDLKKEFLALKIIRFSLCFLKNRRVFMKFIFAVVWFMFEITNE